MLYTNNAVVVTLYAKLVQNKGVAGSTLRDECVSKHDTYKDFGSISHLDGVWSLLGGFCRLLSIKPRLQPVTLCESLG